MRDKLFILGAAAAIMTAFSAQAVSDSAYPASDFQPKVIFSDTEAAKSSASNSEKNNASKPAETDEADPKYPAAYFKPKVIFP